MSTAPESVELLTDRGAVLYLTAAQNFVVNHHHGLELVAGFISGWKCHTTGYAYSIGLGPSPDDALLEWHWHPPDLKYTHAHVHVKDETLGEVGKLHLPTSRVYFEHVVGFLIAGLKIEATVTDWRTPLGDLMKGVEAAATWRGNRPS